MRGLSASSSEWIEVLDRSERRDPAGHAIHLAIALVYLALLPIGTAPAVIMSVPLLTTTLLRWRSVAPLLPALARWAPAWATFALAGWLALSMLWSANVDFGAHQLLSMRVLVLPFCLAPLLARRRWLAGALLGGIVLQAALQCVQYLEHRGAWNFDGLARFGGFTKDPGKAGLWDAIGVCGGVALAITLSRRWSWSGFAIALVTLFGTVASGTRRQIAALAIAVPVLLASAFLAIPQRRTRVGMLVLLGIVALAAAWPLIGPSIMVRLRQTAAQVGERPTSTEGALAPPITGIVHYDLRGFYWSAAFESIRSHPLCGIGLGGSSHAMEASSLRPRMEPWLRQELTIAYPDQTREQIDDEVRSRLDSSHPHSTWLQLLAEGGIIGLMLGVMAWGLAWIAALRRAMHAGVRDPVALACSAALLLWAIGAVFDASLNSTSLGAVVVLAVLGSAHGAIAAPSRR